MTDLTKLAAELRALEAKETPEPWVVERPEQKGEAWPHELERLHAEVDNGR